MFAFGTAMLVTVSLATEAPDYEEIAQYTFTQEIFEQDLQDVGLPWYQDFRYQSAALTAVMLGTIWFFW
jgi:hypothetical protein